MSGQFQEEVRRYGGKILAALGHASNAITEGTKDLRAEAADTIEEVKKTAKDTADWLKEEGLPTARAKLSHASDVVAAHGELTVRRFGAAAREAVSSSEELEGSKERQFDLAKLVFNRKVSLAASMREFLKSDQALLSMEDFDNSGQALRGLPVFPSQKNLSHLRDEFIPVRIYLTAAGIQARVYEQSSPEEHLAGKPQYAFKSERAANADDLFQLQLNAEQLALVIDAASESKAFQAFKAAKKS